MSSFWHKNAPAGIRAIMTIPVVALFLLLLPGRATADYTCKSADEVPVWDKGAQDFRCKSALFPEGHEGGGPAQEEHGGAGGPPVSKLEGCNRAYSNAVQKCPSGSEHSTCVNKANLYFHECRQVALGLPPNATKGEKCVAAYRSQIESCNQPDRKAHAMCIREAMTMRDVCNEQAQ